MTETAAQLDELWSANADYARSIGLSGTSTQTLLYLFALRFLSTRSGSLKQHWRQVVSLRGSRSYNRSIAIEGLHVIARKVEERFPELAGVFTQQLLPSLSVFVSPLDQWVMTLESLGGSVEIDPLDFGRWFDHASENLAVGGAEGFQFMTSRALAELMVRLAAPTAKESIHDPCMGIGTILAAAVTHAAEAAGLLRLSGQEIQPSIAALARLRLFLLGARNARIEVGDVLRDPEFVEPEERAILPGFTPGKSDRLETFDVVLCDPPYGQRFGDIQFAQVDRYRRFRYGLPGRISGDTTFVQHALACLSPKGRAIALIPHGPLLRGGADMEIRRNLVGGDIIDAVVGLPAGMLPGLSLELALLVCRRDKKETEREAKILFVDASQRRDAVGNLSAWKTLSDEIVSIFTNSTDRSSLSRVVPRSEIEANQFSLQPRRYIARDDHTDRIDIQSAMAEAEALERAAVGHAEDMELLLERLMS